MLQNNIEVEVRSFIDNEQYLNFLKKLKIEAEFMGELNEETVYFSGDQDLRLRRDLNDAYLILKKGKLHDSYREEFEIKIAVTDFESMQKLLEALGYQIEIIWLRKRMEFKQEDLKILLDDTKGYGKIIEIEKMVNDREKENVYEVLENKLMNLGVRITSKEDFNKAFEYYKKNWKSLIK